MGFLSPSTALIAAGVTVPLLMALYFLKRRRRRLTVSTTLLWKRSVEDFQANAPFQKLRRNLLLILQLLALGGFLIALARPTLHRTAPPGDRVIILLDRSCSMNATDVRPTRLDVAKERALNLIDNLIEDPQTGALSGAMVVSFAQYPEVIQPFTNNRALLRQAVGSIQPTDQPSRFAPALQLIEPYARGGEGLAGSGGLVAYVFSDGQLQGETPPIVSGVQLRYVKVGRRSENVAIVQFSAQRESQDPARVRIFARLMNYGTQAIRTHLTLKINHQPQRVIQATIPAATATGPGTQPIRFALNLPLSAYLELSHDHTDWLDADNTAWLTLGVPTRLRVLLVTHGNVFLERAIQASGVAQLIRMPPSQYENQIANRWPPQPKSNAGHVGFDLIVFDEYSPKAVPGTHSLYFDGAPPLKGLTINHPPKHATGTQIIFDWKRGHPLMRYTALDNLLIAEPRRLSLPDHAQVLATSQTGPAMALVTDGGVHHVIVAFALLKSNWPMQVGFPVFMKNAMGWFGASTQSETAIRITPGQTVTLPIDPTSDPPVYTGPMRLLARRISPSRAVLSGIDRVGLYRATQAIAPPWDLIAVSLLNTAESNLQPLEDLRIGSSASNSSARIPNTAVQSEVWPWFAAASLVILMIEWFVYTRRLNL